MTGWSGRLAILAVSSALFIQFVDQTALSTALPTLARAFGTDPVNLKLALTSYMMIQALVIPASGWIADRFGARRIFVVAMVLFTVGSILCGLSRSLGTLVLFRLVQGTGAALLTPVARMIVVGGSRREDLVRAMLLLTTPAMVGPLVGPPLTGLILKVADWPWIFYINVPIGVLGVAAVMRFVPRLRQPHPGKFDLVGFVLLALALGGAIGLAETIGFPLISWHAQLAAGIVAIAAGFGFAAHLRSAKNPVIDLRLLRLPSFRASMAGGVFPRLAFGGTPLLLPLLMQVGLGWSALEAGGLFVASAVGALFARALSPPLIDRFGFRRVLGWGVVAVGAATVVPGFFRPETPVVLMVGVLFLTGLFRSSMFNAINTIAYAETPAKSVSAATTFYAVVQQLSLSLGVTLGALSLQGARLLYGGRLTPDSFIIPFAVIGAVTVLGAPVFFRLHPQVGANLARRNRIAAESSAAG
ncbi:MAG TPA: MFS transporter [Caulobacteraceae bacterium]|jgi:EmrB/QacA subfamily drug resistance transporter